MTSQFLGCSWLINYLKVVFILINDAAFMCLENTFA